MTNPKKKWTAEKAEQAMIEGILEGSPDAIGIAVVRYDCGCRKMAAVDQKGEAASKTIMYRDKAESICPKCKKDNGAVARMTAHFIHWIEPKPSEEQKKTIEAKVFGGDPRYN